MTEQSTELTLALPAGNALADVFSKAEAVEDLVSRIEKEVRSFAPDTSTAKGRKAISSLAYKVAQSKSALDEAGKTLTEEARAKIDAVNAHRRTFRERLDALKDEVRKPLTDWEAAEAARVAALKARLDDLETMRADVTSDSAAIRAEIARVEATAIDDSWAEYLTLAAKAKDVALAALRRDLPIAEKREADAAELERLRAEQAKRDEEARIKREAEEAATRLAERAKNARDYITKVGEGMIGGQVQPYGILIYELEQKLPPLIDQLGEHAAALHQLRTDTLTSLRDAAERERAEEELRAEERRKAAADQAAREAEERAAREKAEADARHQREIEDAERRAQEAAQRERERIAAEQRAEDEARAKREADAAHRAGIQKDIAEALAPIPREQIAAALMDGRIPHVKVNL